MMKGILSSSNLRIGVRLKSTRICGMAKVMPQDKSRVLVAYLCSLVRRIST